MTDKYKQAISKIQASNTFKRKALQSVNKKKESRLSIFMSKKLLIGLATCFVLMIGVVAVNNLHSNQQVAIDLTDRINIDSNASNGKVAVNIEGIITEVGKDGLSFKLDNGKWVYINDETKIGISGPTAAPKNEQYFEPTFRVGNSIAGFTENDKANKIEAYAIYTNWNWDNPIK